MKKFICFILIGLLIFSLTSCENKEGISKSDTNASSSELKSNEEKAVRVKSDSQYNKQYIGNKKNKKVSHIQLPYPTSKTEPNIF